MLPSSLSLLRVDFKKVWLQVGERHAKQRVCYSERDKIWLGLERALDYNNQDIFSHGLGHQDRINPNLDFADGKGDQGKGFSTASKSDLNCHQ